MVLLQGNVILTDDKYEILTLLRSHRDDAKGVAIMARHPYPLQTVRLRKPVSEELLRAALASTDPKAAARSEPSYPKPQTLNPKPSADSPLRKPVSEELLGEALASSDPRATARSELFLTAHGAQWPAALVNSLAFHARMDTKGFIKTSAYIEKSGFPFFSANRRATRWITRCSNTGNPGTTS